jgi:hypothetical protein
VNTKEDRRTPSRALQILLAQNRVDPPDGCLGSRLMQLGSLCEVGGGHCSVHASGWSKAWHIPSVSYMGCRPPLPSTFLTLHPNLITPITKLHKSIPGRSQTRSLVVLYLLGLFLTLIIVAAVIALQVFAILPSLWPDMSDSSLHLAQRPKQYRKVEYRRGDLFCIQETRRRSPAVELAGHLTPSHRHQTFRPQGDFILFGPESEHNHTKVFPSNPGKSSLVLDGFEHVTSGSPSASVSTRAKPVILQTTSSAVPREKLLVKSNTAHSLPTPPPTPKFERLATPEFSDFDDAPFCDCCLKTHIVRCCASCGSPLKQH